MLYYTKFNISIESFYKHSLPVKNPGQVVLALGYLDYSSYMRFYFALLIVLNTLKIK